MCAVMSKFNSSLGDAGFPCYPHVVPEQFVTIAYTFAGGSILRWFRDTFAEVEAAKAKSQGQDPYDVLLTDIPDSPGELFLVPHFSGTGTPWFDMQARGSILGLTLNTKRSEIVKAILEGTAHELATNAGILESAGLPIQELHAIGGSAKSKKDIQLRTNIMNRTVKVMKVTEACAFGAALLAGVGAGVYESVEAASCRLVELENAYTPEPEIAKQ
jgi:xylulokinase